MPARRHPRPLRHPGDRLLALGPQPRHHRGPGHLPDRHRAPRRAAREGDPRLLRLRLLLRLRHLRGRHRPLLGALAASSSTSSKIQPRLPEGVRTELGPDATSVGWVFQYALVDRSGRHDLAELRSLQDWYLRYHLQAVPGVAEVAAVGGFVKQYQVTRRPEPPRSPTTCRCDASSTRSASGNAETRRAPARARRHRVHGARPRLRALVDDLENIVVGVDATTRHAGPGAARRHASTLGPGHPPRRRRPRRRAATRSAASSSCATARTRSTSSSA